MFSDNQGTTMENSTARLLIAVVILAAGLPWDEPRAEAPHASSPTSQTRDNFSFSKALPAAALDRYRGGSEVHILDIKSDGMVSDNVAYDLTTGHNYIGEGSFSGASGFPTVIQNSGNNVLIQNSTNINLQLQ
jgi:hypothetical protein